MESRWAIPVAAATLLAVALIVGTRFVDSVSGDGTAEVLRSVDENSGSVIASALMQAAAFVLLTLPLVYLFRAAAARSDRVRSQLIGLVIAAPLFLALSSGLAAVSQQEAADQFLAGEAKSTLTAKEAREDCVEERQDDGNDFLVDEYDPAQGESPLRACESRKVEDDEASNARTETDFAPFATGFGIAGGLGFVISLVYSCLWAMRTGLLTRFWGALGMALGIGTLLGLLPFLLIWLVYFALLVIGKVPGGKPPAWEAGEAIPWPTPGEKAAEELEPEDGWSDEDQEADEVDSETGERRKRKQRE
ncbi:MAG TPA: hypothetical protein VFU16_05895 [Solirubrobacterales bacterium]|nr:hypothetical protein [Solirubrobacterales bacterium]